jgi:hypothetical protein
MTIEMTPDQAATTLKALRCRLNYMESLRLRLQPKTFPIAPPSKRLREVTIEIVNLQLAISAVEEAMLRR